MSKFAPLHIISGYSFLQSGLTMAKISTAIKNGDYFGAGLTDENVLFGLPSFSHSMIEINKPYVLGMDVVIDGANISLFIKNENGYKNLLHINYLIQTDKLSLNELKSRTEGLIAVIETNHGSFKENFLKEQPVTSIFTHWLGKYSELFKDDFYLGNEVTSKEEVSYANKIRKFANQYTYKCVAFPRIKYLKKDDAIVLKIVKAISEGVKDMKEMKAEGQEYFMSNDAYSKIYNKEEIENTNAIIKSTTFDLNIKRGEILHFPVENSEQTLKEECYQSLKAHGLDQDEKYIKQLEYELSVIISMGYADYFLLVQDYVRWAKNNGILVGPGRGSAAGALVSYLLDLTEIDPLKYDLQFERFLNPNRKTMPDIDTDFMDIRRDEVVQYMREKFGNSKVANIVAFQTIKAKQSLRDVGRTYGIPERHISLLTKTLTGKDYSLGKSYRLLPEFKNLVDSDDYFKQIVSLAGKIEGLPRQEGQHAAGVVLSNKPMEDVLPVTVDLNDNYISQFEAGYLEEQGFLKMDFLGLRNLTTVALCCVYINSMYPELKLKPDQIPYDEKEIFDLISSGQTMGLFQIDTTVMKHGINILKPSCFEDVVALLALNRPGPMQFISTYANRRDGKEKVNYISDGLKKILAPTYGIIVYQEQVNKIATEMAGFTPADADIFRRAISKKDKDKMVAYEKQFYEGAIKNGYTEKNAKDVFNLILKFANYGFNRSHSVVYAVLACRMAWLKAHYPLEFYAAILETGSSSNDDKFLDYIKEMKKRGIKVSLPSVNNSMKLFIIKDNELLFPLNSIKGINDILAQQIIDEREENGPFKDFFDFVLRMFRFKISEKEMTALIDSGAFDEFSSSRESMRSSVRNALQFAQLNYNADGQLNLGFSLLPAPALAVEIDNPLDNLDKEYESIGIMLSNNPLDYKTDLITSKGAIPISEIPPRGNVTICGIVSNKKIIKTKKGSSMAFVKIYDQSDEVEVTVFSTLFEKVNSIINKNDIIVVKGRFDGRGKDISFVADDITLLED